MVRAPRKALKLGRAALKSAARLPARVSHGSRNGGLKFEPLPGESPIVVLKVQVVSCKDLLAKDRNGFSDPFVVVTVLGKHQETPAVKRTLNPSWNAKDATFEFPLYLSLADRLGVLELVIWDKDFIKKDYIGEVSIPLEDWFKDDNAFGFDDPANKPLTLNVVSTRTSTPASGTITVKLGFEHPQGVANLMEFREVYAEFLKLSRPSLVSAPPTEGIGTVRSNAGGPELEDDGLSSDDEDSNTDDENEELPTPSLTGLFPPPVTPPALQTPHAITVPAPEVAVQSPSPVTPTPATPTAATILKTPTLPKSPSAFSIPKVFSRRPTNSRSNSVDSTGVSSGAITPSTSGTSVSGTSSPSTPLASPSGATTPLPRIQPGKEKEKAKFRKSWASKSTGFNLTASRNDILGIVMLEIQGAKDLPKLRNLTRTGWDMDPFVVISFGKKVFRTRVVRHSLNPTWEEKLLFHVRRYETSYKIQFTVLDWDKLSSNDHVGDAYLEIGQLLANAPQKNPETGLYPEDHDGTKDGMVEFKLHLSTAKEMPWESKHNPELVVRAKYQPYDALRQRFWRQYLRQYDTDDTNTISRLELTSMLDSLGSTLSHSTIDSFFHRFGRDPHEGQLTMDEAIQCLETELCRPTSEKKRLVPNGDDTSADSSAPMTPLPRIGGTEGPLDGSLGLNLDKLDFSGQAGNIPASDSESSVKPTAPPPQPTDPMQQPLEDAVVANTSASNVAAQAQRGRPPRAVMFNRQASTSSSDAEDSSSPSSSSSSSSSPTNSDDSFERVINVKNCPLCHRPRLNSKAEVDIVTHLAICASQDWGRVDRIVVGNFVTASQAQRKWYTKVISKVSSGDYKLGANSANIIVQNRMTGQLEEEKMQVYVRLGIRLLYKGWKSRMEGNRARRLLKSLSIKQGAKYDSPESVRDIPAFIEFHKLNVNEIADPLDSFKSFNEFFYRRLKPDARPVDEPDNPYRLVSGADCRLMAFETVTDATRLWIKGRDFSVHRLLGDAYKHEADKYVGGALCIFRLAPQDYHRFHSPVDGVIGPMTFIPGEYYTVNPQAIRTALDVYGENVRKIVPIDSPQFGRVMAVCIGAMMVGSIKTTVEEGQEIKRGQEFGYFAFGTYSSTCGSTIVVLFEKGVVEWDEDLLINSNARLETLVRVGMGIGRSRRAPEASNA
ncbi:hypothetical protein K474DRAFT_1686324 [Panus rudis PR-1116 ss-1]|nr:hypothetical protein K474DRAFT_1686324 [Panus rudis PR-1116 ss-1]